MRSLRDFIGSDCPACRTDILQRPPSKNRMPIGEDHAYCPNCDQHISVSDLQRMTRRRGGILARLFGGRARRTA